MSFEVEIDTAALNAMISGLEAKIDRPVRELAFNVEKHAKAMMGPGPGPASAPGRPPNRQTSNLINSINTQKKSVGVYIVTDGTEYGLPLELGHHISLRGKQGPMQFVAARPFMVPALDKAFGEAMDKMREAFK